MPIPSRWTRHKNKVGCPQTFDSSMSVRQQHIFKYPCLLLPISCICIQDREEVLCTMRLGGWQVGSLISYTIAVREHWPRHPLGNLTLSNQLSTPATQCFIYSLFQLVFPLDINEICLCFSCTLYLGPIHSHIAARHQQTRIRNEIEEGRKINNIRLFYA